METTNTTKTEAETLFQSLDKPSLHSLSYALRHPDTWPSGFVWNYQQCHQCAMGLAHLLWKEAVPETNRENAASIMARQFALPYEEAQRIFLGSGGWVPSRYRTETDGSLFWNRERQVFDSGESLRAVTPAMVADQIDAYLSRAE